MTPYADTTYADAYFEESFFADDWDDEQIPRKTKALKEATKRIDMLRFVGFKTSVDQENQFPRNGDTDVPDNIKKACCELALKFVQGIHPDLEIDSARIVTSGMSSARMSNDTSRTPVWIDNGIPSPAAWALLCPYLKDNLTVRLP